MAVACFLFSPVGLPGYPTGYMPTTTTIQQAATNDRMQNLSGAAAAAAYYTDYPTAMTAAAGVNGIHSIASQMAAAATGAVGVPRSDPSPIPLSTSPISQRQPAGTAGTSTAPPRNLHLCKGYITSFALMLYAKYLAEGISYCSRDVLSWDRVQTKHKCSTAFTLLPP